MAAISLSLDETLIRNTTDKLYIHNITETTIAPRDIITIITNITDSSFNNSIKDFIIASKNCPDDARDIYPGEDVFYIQC